jgi:hypothetical protein
MPNVSMTFYLATKKSELTGQCCIMRLQDDWKYYVGVDSNQKAMWSSDRQHAYHMRRNIAGDMIEFLMEQDPAVYFMVEETLPGQGPISQSILLSTRDYITDPEGWKIRLRDLRTKGAVNQ